MNAASSAAAVSVRTASNRLAAACGGEQSRVLRVLDLLAGASEPPLAAAIPIERLVERHGIEVRPEALGEEQLGVSKLPEQEVADALLAPGANEQVRLGRIRHRKIRRKVLFCDPSLDRTGLLARQPRQSLQDVPAPTVVGRDRQREAGIALGQALAGLDQRPDLQVEAARVADDLEADGVLVKLLHFAGERADEK